jgi:hypothetical protein
VVEDLRFKSHASCRIVEDFESDKGLKFGARLGADRNSCSGLIAKRRSFFGNAAKAAAGGLQFLIARIAHASNERMARRLDYVQEEVRVLKEALRAAPGCSGFFRRRSCSATPKAVPPCDLARNHHPKFSP